MILIDIQSLTFKYALAQGCSLDNISLTVHEGDFFLLFGPSGCGKTTLLRHLKRELTPAGEKGGQVLYDGQEIAHLDPTRSACEIGLVLQNPDNQIVTDVVWHELAFGLENLGVSPTVIRRRVAEMASFFGIGALFHKKTAELSGGQKQLVNLASVLAMQPRLLLLDEPTAQLDPIAAREFIDMVSRLNRELGITVVMTEHRLEEVMPIATTVALMDKGQVKCCASPRLLPAQLTKEKDGDHALESMPAAVRIFAKAVVENCPLTVREGKERLSTILNAEGQEKIPHRKPANGAHEGKVDDAAHKTNEKSVAAIDCRDLYFRYQKDAPDILSGLSLRADYGSLLCLLGENGSGKSTLLQLMAGILRPQRGAMVVSGKNLRTLSAQERYIGNIGLLPQNPKAVFLNDTVRADLGDRGEEIARSLGIESLLDRHPYDLSGGEQQKAALARVLLQKPRILLLDEPTKGLDAPAKRELSEFLVRLRDDGACIIVSTHDVDFAAEYADSCALLFDGCVASEGKTREFFSGNCFYTTAANRIARDFDPGAITCADVRALWRK